MVRVLRISSTLVAVGNVVWSFNLLIVGALVRPPMLTMGIAGLVLTLASLFLWAIISGREGFARSLVFLALLVVFLVVILPVGFVVYRPVDWWLVAPPPVLMAVAAVLLGRSLAPRRLLTR